MFTMPEAWEPDMRDGDLWTVTAEELAAHPEWRGVYEAGKSTREEVVLSESICERYNCWQMRHSDGTIGLVSEPPATILARQAAATP